MMFALEYASKELIIAFQSVLRVRIKRSEGDYSEADNDLVPILKQNVGPAEVREEVKMKTPRSPKFSEVQERQSNAYLSGV